MMALVSRLGLAKIPRSSFCAVGSTFSTKVIRNLTTPAGGKTSDSSSSYKFVVLGGGTGGLSMASFLSRQYPHQVVVVEPEQVCSPFRLNYNPNYTYCQSDI